MPLSDVACRGAKPGDKPYRKADGGGLSLLVQPNGSKLWQWAYRYQGRQRTLSIGAYPVVSLADARARRDEGKRRLALGEDPRAPVQGLVPNERRLETVARRWHDTMKARWVPSHAARVLSRLEHDVFPVLGARRLDSIDPPEILAALRSVEARGALDVARRLRQHVSMVYRFAIAEGLARHDPTVELSHALQPPRPVTHMASLPADALPEFFSRLDQYDGVEQTRVAIELMLHTMVRTNELRGATWAEVGRDLWRIPAHRMKMSAEHIVPLTPAAQRLLERLRELSGGSPLVVPGEKPGKPISQNTMIFALYRMGYHSKLTIHGFRRTASTILNESGLWDPDWIERQLAHVEANKVRGAYNAAQYLDHRRRMMLWWSDYLGRQKIIGELI